MGFSKAKTSNGISADVTRMRKLEKLAYGMLDANGLTDWDFEWDKAVARFGACHYGKKTITVSLPLAIRQETDGKFVETMLHEIAHALTPGKGHGAEWKMKCLELGIKPERCYDEATIETVDYKYHGYCPTGEHGIVAGRHRIREASHRRACAKCCDEKNYGKYDAKYAIIWKEVR